MFYYSTNSYCLPFSQQEKLQLYDQKCLELAINNLKHQSKISGNQSLLLFTLSRLIYKLMLGNDKFKVETTLPPYRTLPFLILSCPDDDDDDDNDDDDDDDDDRE